MSNALPIKEFHHVDLVVGNAQQAAFYYWKAFGFDQVGYLGPETGRKDRVSYALRQGDILLSVTCPVRHDDPMNLHHTLHGDTVQDVAFTTDDVDGVFREVVSRGAQPVQEPTDLVDDHGKVRRAAIRTFGEVVHSFLSTKEYDGPFLPGYVPLNKKGFGAGLLTIDHVVGNVEDRQMERWVQFYTDVLGFDKFVSYDDKDISTEFSALRSTVVANENRKIKMPINEPAKGKRRSQIQEYIDFHAGPGVQHLAFLTGDIVETIARLRENGVEFLEVPESYYDSLWSRVGDVKENKDKIKALKILVDRDESGYLLQNFTRPVEDRPTLFIELIQRRGCQSFGKGNFKALFEAIEREQKRRGNL
jgi:4-hydroxyphenylpyruvate dioxygenase